MFPSPPLYLSQSILQQGKKQPNVEDDVQDSCLLRYLADCDFNMCQMSISHSLTETMEGSSFSSEDQQGLESRNVTPPSNQRTLPLGILQDAHASTEQQDAVLCRRALDILQEMPHADAALTVPSRPQAQEKAESKSVTQDWSHPSVLQRKPLSAGQRGLKEDTDADRSQNARSIEKTLQEVVHLLKLQHPGPVQLDELEYQLFCIRDKLKVWFGYHVLAFATYHLSFPLLRITGSLKAHAAMHWLVLKMPQNS